MTQQTSSFSALGIHTDHDCKRSPRASTACHATSVYTRGESPEGHPSRPTAASPADHDMD